MKTAQDYLKETASGEARGGFNARLQGQTHHECMDGMPAGSRWGERNAGWDLANKMIMNGEIFSRAKINGKEIEFKCFRDGDSWCCVGPDFVNLQESDNYAFGDSRDEAIINFSEVEVPEIFPGTRDALRNLGT